MKFNPFKDFQSDQIHRGSRKILTAHYACRNADCVVPENIHTPPPTADHWKFRGGGGVQRQLFPRGRGGSWETTFPEADEPRTKH